MLPDIAEDLNVNAIVMGSRGKTGMKRLLMGSVTEKVICHAPVPCLWFECLFLTGQTYNVLAKVT